MIRVYFDWNVISDLKREGSESLRLFLEKHKRYLLIPYTPAHFADVMKSYSDTNSYFNEDIQTLTTVCRRHLLRWKDHQIEPLLAEPTEYLKNEIGQAPADIEAMMDMEQALAEVDKATEEMGLPKLGSLMKSLFKVQPIGFDASKEGMALVREMFPNVKPDSNMWDLMKDIGPFAKKLLHDRDYYVGFRKSIGEGGFKLEGNAGNWNSDEVNERVTAFLKSKGVDMSFFEFVESAFKHRKEPADRYEFFTTAYNILDMIGYKSDKLPKATDSMLNVTQDAEHAFYAGHCDYFVASDKKLRSKAKALYRMFNVPTVVLAPADLTDTLAEVIHDVPTDSAFFLRDALAYVDIKNEVERHPVSEDLDVESIGIKLPIFYLNFFTHVIYQNYEGQGVVLTFRKVFKNYSRFIFYTESEALLETVLELFGYSDTGGLLEKKKQFVYGEVAPTFSWQFEDGLILLERELDTHRPVLKYFIGLKH